MSLPLNLTLIDPRRIRSFVTRQGRLTRAQREAIEENWQTFGLDAAEPWVPDSRYAEHILEIGFGNGHSLAQMAHAQTDCLFIGIEVHQPGLGALLLEAQRLNLTNIRIYYADANDVLNQAIPNQTLDRIQLFFPDPWPKKRHFKRRIIQIDFLKLLSSKLKPGGHLHLATDWGPYASHMLACCNNLNTLENLSPDQGFVPRPCYRPLTKFEKRGHAKGHQVWDLLFRVC